jgi:hypothetical protein
MHIQAAVIARQLAAEHGFRQMRLADDFAWMAAQLFEQVEFGAGQE